MWRLRERRTKHARRHLDAGRGAIDHERRAQALVGVIAERGGEA
jgi:hypothetical protein